MGFKDILNKKNNNNGELQAPLASNIPPQMPSVMEQPSFDIKEAFGGQNHQFPQNMPQNTGMGQGNNIQQNPVGEFNPNGNHSTFPNQNGQYQNDQFPQQGFNTNQAQQMGFNPNMQPQPVQTQPAQTQPNVGYPQQGMGFPNQYGGNGQQMPNMQPNPGQLENTQPQIGGNPFVKDQSRPNPLVGNRNNVKEEVFNMDRPQNIPVNKVNSNQNKNIIEPEYYGQLRPYFEQSNISSIHMYSYNCMSIQINGQEHMVDSLWNSEEEFIEFLHKLINWNEKNPHSVSLYNFRKEHKTFGTYYMKDLSRLHIAVTEDDIYATIAVKRQDTLSLEDLCGFGMFNDEVKNFIYLAIQANAKIVFAGQGGAGKTTFVQACGNIINARNSTLVAEEYRELTLNRPNVKYVHAADNRPLSKIVAESTKMRIRNLIVGEVISVEALAMLEAMNTGLDVVLATTHANSAYEALNRLVSLSCSNPNVSAKFVKTLIGNNVDMIVFLEEINGKKVLSEIIGIEKYQEEIDKIICNHIYDIKKNKITLQQATSSRIMKKIEEHKARQREMSRGQL